MKRLCIALSFIIFHLSFSVAQTDFGQKPKLVVGIVVDQMRWDYLDRYYDKFVNDGFRRLIDQGYSLNNCLINYIPTVTAIGHASVYTGTTPALHGICGNNFHIDGRKVVSCQDDSVRAVGSKDEDGNGRRSPRNMLSTTIGDQLRLHSDFRSKVIGVSFKDRAAIFPAGHSANGAYWLDTRELCFITSTYYMDELPSWAKQMNASLKRNRDVQREGDRIGYSPLCGTVITDMAIAAMRGEHLGQGEATDMLCISYSQTDIIGHEWGTRGERTDKAYLTLDRDLSRLLKALDVQVGRGNYLLFLTADHGASHNWNFMREHKMQAGAVMSGDVRRQAEEYIRQQLGNKENVIADVFNYRYFIDRASVARQGLDLQKVKDMLIEYLKTVEGIVSAIDFEKVRQATLPNVIVNQIVNGYYPGRSGDVVTILRPQYYEWWRSNGTTHTTHGAWNPYDAHIPLLFYGWNVEHGATSREVHITDIAPTVCQMLHIQQPNACIGEAITEITK